MIQDTMLDVNAEPESVATLSDEEVLVLSRQSPELFQILLDRYEAAFLRKARSILRVPEDAEEVVQDTFTRMYLYADKYEKQVGASFSSWGYTILTRLAFTRYQKLKKERGRVEPLDPEVYERLSEETTFLDGLTIQNEVLMALVKLPEAARKVLSLQFFEGKTQEEIAETEGSTVPAVKTRVHRAKKLLRDALLKNQQTHES